MLRGVPCSISALSWQPPLSAKKRISVLSSFPRSRIALTTLPIPRSMHSIIAAYTSMRRSQRALSSVSSHEGTSGSRSLSTQESSRIPVSACRAKRCLRSSSQPIAYLPLYLSMSACRACNGQCGAV